MPNPLNTFHRRSLTAKQRFGDGYRVDALTDCWNWIKSTRGQGYGQFWMDGKNMKASRAAWILFRGPIPHGMKVLHSCDNRKCVNYRKHLFLGTSKDNSQDMIHKGRQNPSFGERHSRHKLTTTQAQAIRNSSLKGIELARLYGVGPMQISRIRRGLRWRHLNVSNAS